MTAPEDWDRCKRWIEAALEGVPAFETIEDIEREIEAGRYMFWAGKNSAALAEYGTQARLNVAKISRAGGDLHSLVKEFLPAHEQFGRLAGCELSMIVGRKGWERVLKSEGYRHGATILIKDLV